MPNAFSRFRKARKNSNSKRYPRKLFDEILEFLRFTKVEPYVPKGATLLDVGSGDGNFLRYLNGHLESAVGIDLHLTHRANLGNAHLVPGYFPYDFAETDRTFDVITLMAVAEHIPMAVLSDVADACWKYLKPDGQVILTVQHPRVEGLLDLLNALGIIEGFSMHEHYGFDPECLPEIFNAWKLIKREQWGFGCNNLFIFEKP